MILGIAIGQLDVNVPQEVRDQLRCQVHGSHQSGVPLSSSL